MTPLTQCDYRFFVTFLLSHLSISTATNIRLCDSFVNGTIQTMQRRTANTAGANGASSHNTNNTNDAMYTDENDDEVCAAEEDPDDFAYESGWDGTQRLPLLTCRIIGGCNRSELQ